MFTGYLTFAGVELVNDARTAAYSSALGLPGGGCEDCPPLAGALGTVYVSPAADPAPWYDPAVAASGEFAGLVVQAIDGVGGTGTRNVTPLARGGGVVGPHYQRPKELTLTLLLLASTQQGAAYGAAWLARQLRGRECSVLAPEYTRLDTGRVCGSDTLCMFTGCPLTAANTDDYRVTLYDVGVTSGPEIIRTQIVGDPGACQLSVSELEVTFTAGDPSWYASPVRVADVALSDYFVASSVPYDIRTSYSDLDCGTQACFDTPPAGCTVTNGPLMVAPPQACVGQPDFTANFYSIPLNVGGVTSTFEAVPLLYYTGSEATPATSLYEGPVAFQLRRAHPDEPCGEVANPCNVGAEFFTSQQRRDRRGLLDFRQRKAYRTVSAVPVCPYPVFSRELAPFTWPTIVCGSDMCLDVYINRDNDGRGQRIELDLMRRLDAVA
jgi:hypothetical protein